MNIKSICAIVLCCCLLAACGNSGAADKSNSKAAEAVATSAAEPAIEYSEFEIRDIIVPASAKAKVTDKRDDLYSLLIDDKWDIDVSMQDAGDDIVTDKDKMRDNAKTLFLLYVSSIDYEEALKTSCIDEEDYINGYDVYTFSYKGNSGIAACRMLGSTKYTIYSFDDGASVNNCPSNETFKAFIEELEIVP